MELDPRGVQQWCVDPHRPPRYSILWVRHDWAIHLFGVSKVKAVVGV